MTIQSYRFVGVAVLLPLLWCAIASGQARSDEPPPSVRSSTEKFSKRLLSLDATLTFEFSIEALDDLGFWITPQGQISSDITPQTPPDERNFPLSITFDATNASTLAILAGPGFTMLEGEVRSCGAIMSFIRDERVVIANPTLQRDPQGELRIVGGREVGATVEFFRVDSVRYRVTDRQTRFELEGTVRLSPSLAKLMGRPDAVNLSLGEIFVEGSLAPVHDPAAAKGSCAAELTAKGTVAGWTPTSGPDVIVADLPTVMRYGRIGDITSYAIATVSCNIGDERVDWVYYSNKHPVIMQNAFRLDDHGLQQIGMAWLKHGFYAVSQSLCTPCNDPTNGRELGVGCSDPYSAPLNGDQSNMSPRTVVNAHTGEFPYPAPGPAYQTLLDRRLQIRDADLDPALNPDASYFIQSQYLTADDAAAGNQDNNASYRQVHVATSSPNVYLLLLDSTLPTRRGRAPVRAWKDLDPEVVETDIRVPGEGLFILAAKATSLTNGMWRYIYALQNLNSDRSARTFSVEVPTGTVFENIGFHDIDYHSGESIDGTDWVHFFDGRYLKWSTQTYAENPFANALRYDTVYNFWFDCNVPPAPSKIVFDLFKPGAPVSVTGSTVGPLLDMIDCNGNGVADSCDLDCGLPGCLAACGGGTDCNNNLVPDDCEPDCNQNGVADECDMIACTPGDWMCGDCNQNDVLDGCESDCDGDTIIDDCDPPDDTDGDGITDCFDLCPTNTPPGGCQCPFSGLCCFANGMCIANFPRASCLAENGTPDCLEAPCRNGCLLGDYDRDGDLDLADFAAIQTCFSASKDLGGYIVPSQECTIPLDFDNDEDVDVSDYAEFSDLCSGP
jgi:hypothetical protein